MNTTYLEPAQVPPHLQSVGGYSGRKFQATAIDKPEINISGASAAWYGGSRSSFYIVQLSTGKAVNAASFVDLGNGLDPHDGTIKLEPGYALVEHSIFQGKDMGLRFKALAQDIAPLLPDLTDTFTDTENAVLYATKSWKASYNGMDRYEMLRRELGYGRDKGRPVPTREQWNEAKAGLIARKYLNKAGAITPKGKNAAPQNL